MDPLVDSTRTYLLSIYEVGTVLGGRQTVLEKNNNPDFMNLLLFY